MCEEGGEQHESFLGRQRGGAVGMNEVVCEGEVDEGALGGRIRGVGGRCEAVLQVVCQLSMKGSEGGRERDRVG